MRPIVVICSLLLLAGCATGTCPAVKQYTIPEQQAIAKEWNALPDNSALQSPLTDWERMRRVCR